MARKPARDGLPQVKGDLDLRYNEGAQKERRCCQHPAPRHHKEMTCDACTVYLQGVAGGHAGDVFGVRRREDCRGFLPQREALPRVSFCRCEIPMAVRPSLPRGVIAVRQVLAKGQPRAVSGSEHPQSARSWSSTVISQVVLLAKPRGAESQEPGVVQGESAESSFVHPSVQSEAQRQRERTRCTSFVQSLHGSLRVLSCASDYVRSRHPDFAGRSPHNRQLIASVRTVQLFETHFHPYRMEEASTG